MQFSQFPDKNAGRKNYVYSGNHMIIVHTCLFSMAKNKSEAQLQTYLSVKTYAAQLHGKMSL